MTLGFIAQTTQPGSFPLTQDGATVVLILAAAVAVPFLLAVTTSFLKLVVVGHILRSALGTPGVPPTAIITGLAIVLSMHIMAPTAHQVYERVREVQAASAGSTLTWSTGQTFAAAAAQPVRTFLARHTHAKELALFAQLQSALQSDEPVTTRPTTQPSTDASTADWTILLPAFVISELSEAFQIGFILFVPFVVIDLIVGNVLMAMGMFMLSPTVISLPIKLLLFVLVDGWHVITRGLVLGYT